MKLKINNKDYDVSSDPETPLLWVLRDELKLTGTKYGCGIGFCGTCTVLIDGSAERSCITPISVLSGKSIQTIEGLGENGLHKVQKAWIELGVAQCGYCQPAQILTAVSLLNNTPLPTDENINAVMSDVVCRCGTYNKIREAIHLAAGG
jgi:aerobic-type carbon monoxide dehydrogenase small subunit (CoxS/CutS family)